MAKEKSSCSTFALRRPPRIGASVDELGSLAPEAVEGDTAKALDCHAADGRKALDDVWIIIQSVEEPLFGNKTSVQIREPSFSSIER